MELDFLSPAPSSAVREACAALAAEYPSVVSLFRLGTSLAGQPIEYLRIGEGQPIHLIVGAHHGSEHITALILVRFVLDCARAITSGEKLCGCDIRYIFSKRTAVVVPVVNPDGIDIQQGVFPPDRIIYPRLVSMNPAGRDFTHWQANARGVDLNHNYAAGFAECRTLEKKLGICSGCPSRYGGAYPESEPETRALCSLTRLLSDRLRTAVSLHTQGEEIYYGYGDHIPDGTRVLAEAFSQASGYRLSAPEGIASYGGFKDWVTEELDIPAFTIECGRGENPLPPGDFYEIYAKLLPLLLADCAFK